MHLDLSGTAGLLATQPLLSAAQSKSAKGASFGPVTYSALIDATLGYQRDPLPLRFELRYQLMRQFAGAKPPCTATEPAPYCEGTPNPAIPAVPEIRRQNLEFVVTYFFPHAPAVGTNRPAVVPIPSPTSNPGLLTQLEPTRGQIDDQQQKNAHDKQQKSDKASDTGGPTGGGSGAPGGGAGD